MHLKHFVISAIVLILINSCKLSNKNKYSFDPRSIKGVDITLSYIADDILYIPLPNSFPLGDIGLFIFSNQSFYFYSDEGILAYDRESRQLRKIGKKGRGPGEYLFSSLFTVDNKSETVYILDQGDIVKTYSKSGQFIRSFSIQRFGSPASIDFINSELFVSYNIQFENAKYIWVVFDTMGIEIKRRNSGIPTFKSIYGTGNATYKLGNRIYYWNAYTDTVFSVLPDLSEEPSFFLSTGEHRFPRSKDVPVNPYERYMVLNSIFETNRYIVFRYFYKNSNFLILDKYDNKHFLVKLEYDQNVCINGILNDLDVGPMFLPLDYFIDNGREFLIGLINPINIKVLVTNKGFIKSTPKYPEKKKKLERLANSLKDTDNPVLMIVRLKK